MRRPKVPDQDQRKLEPELQRTLDEVGPKEYGYATAKDFAPGGKFSQQRRTRKRFALT